VTYSIPESDSLEFHSLPIDVQEDVRLMLGILRRINGSAKGVQAKIRAEARLLQDRRGYSRASINRKRSLYKESGGDWRVLVDHARAKDLTGQKLPPDFIEFWKALVDENHRKCRPARRKLVRMWQAGESIPGYGTWQEWFLRENEGRPLPPACPPDLPDGWSYRNLMRFQPTKAERALTQRGVNAARLELPTVIGTREGLRFMEWIVLDDWRSDFRVMVPGVPHPCQLNGILALDVACALPMRFGLRPATPQDDSSLEGIKRRDAKALIAGILGTFGYPEDYVCNVVLERGTATIAPEDAAAIEEITGGHVKLHYTCMIAGSVFGYADRPLGNFLGKAWLESYFNLAHNEAADLPGQIGARYELAPQSTDVKIREAEALVKAGRFLPPELRRDLHFPFLGLGEARTSIEHICRRLALRTEHGLEGFAEVMEWREKRLDQWRPAHEALGMPPAVQDVLEWRTRLESPWGRRERLAQGVTFRKVHPSCLPRILEEHKRITVQKPGEVKLTIRGKDLVFQDLDSPQLQAGAEYLAYYDGQDPEWIHLTDGRGAYLCSVRQAKAVRRYDHAALADAIAAKQASLKRLTDAVNRRNAGKLAGRLDDLQANERLIQAAADRAGAVDLVPATAGASGDAPMFAQQIDQVAEAQRAIAEQKAKTDARVRSAKGDLDDVIFREDESDAEQAEYAQAQADLDALDQIY